MFDSLFRIRLKSVWSYIGWYSSRTLTWVWLLFAFTPICVSAEPPVDFSRDILPVLSDNCFKCHGPDEANREGGLRLDNREGAFVETDTGDTAIVPGHSDQSAVFQRIAATDADLRMPPVDSGKTLSDAEIQRIRNWIDSGAEWSGHWAFQPPERPRVPPALDGWLSENPIDRFIHSRLRRANLLPEPPADKAMLIRRVTLDLTGLPPTITDLDNFIADESPRAFERVVDRLLESTRYGEHMARVWLDAARYADTHGLHLDNERSMWPYRQWVIDAFNRNMPFDQFTIEQLAGDLLPNPTLEQRVATGFNRCNVTTSEGGSIDDEYYARYAVDRVETTATVWLGLTAGCAACHDHKFDPLTQREFYQLFSYFFSLTEKAMDGNALLPPPVVKVPSSLQLRHKRRLQADLTQAEQQIAATLDELEYSDSLASAELKSLAELDIVWFDDHIPAGSEPGGDGETPWQFVSAPEHPVFGGKLATVRAAEGLSQQTFSNATKRLQIGPHDRLFAYVFLDPDNPPETIQLQFNDGSWNHRAYWGADKGHAAGKKNAENRKIGELPEAGKWVRLEVPAGAVGLNAGAELNGWAFTQFNGKVYWDKAGLVSVAPLNSQQRESLSVWEQFRQRVMYPELPAETQKTLDTPSGQRSEEQNQQLSRYFLQHVHSTTRQRFAEPLQRQTDLRQELANLEKAVPATLVMEERKEPRQAHILERGEYTLKRDKVASQIPQWISPALPSAQSNRLGLAEWLVSPGHPLTSRVTVNRLWQPFFGTGLVKTSEDFGVQGEQPSHPQLLDWLAVDFIQSGWDVKRLQKMMVMSATYRQASRISGHKLDVDPDNRLLARGPRYRLDAEVIRDQALSISGLLVPRIGGKSVRPYQPAGLWKPVGFGGSNTSVFKQDAGSSLYRRSMYTFWKRTSPPPSMSTFDAPNRETCQVRRARTNTPLQALVLMNDVQFFEAARKFAERVMTEGGTDVRERMTYAFRSATARYPNERERRTLTRLLREYQDEFSRDPEAAAKLLVVGESPRNESVDAQELGAWTMIAHLLLNLNETVTKG